MVLCTKRRFGSSGQARRQHKRAGFRVRTYRCDDCGAFHVANADKRRALGPELRPVRRRTGPDRGIEELTVAQEQAIVDRAIDTARRRRLEQGAVRG